MPQKRYFCFSRTIIVIPLFPAAHGVAFFVHSSPQLGSVSYTQIPPGICDVCQSALGGTLSIR
ncbi:hypothetical protein [Escherichia coli]|uniref:hypothetical protein n=1 Tax=Escherichia coli TaxID=562 RepID=UPI0038F79CD9